MYIYSEESPIEFSRVYFLVGVFRIVASVLLTIKEMPKSKTGFSKSHVYPKNSNLG